MSTESVAGAQETDEGCDTGGKGPEESQPGEGIKEDGREAAGSKPSHAAVQVITRFMCKFCGRQFIRRADMDAHALLHDDERPPLTCGVCGKVYNTRSKLQRHVRVHSGERPFPCTVCGKRFPRSDHVKQHMRVHSKLPGGAAILVAGPAPVGLTHKSHCRLCGVKFEDRSELGQHLLTHGFNRLYSCIYCGEVFECNDKLKKHKLVHEARAMEDYLPVLSVPHPAMSARGSTLVTNGTKKKRPGRPKGSKNVNRRRKDLSRMGFSKFKITRRSGTEAWQTVAPVLKTEESSQSPERSASTSEHPMPILERILLDSSTVVKLEKDVVEGEDRGDQHSDSEGQRSEDSEDPPQMSITACYSLAEGQDISDIPDIEEIRASTLLEGNNMIVVPSGDMDEEDEEEEEDDSSKEEEGEEERGEEGEGGVSQASSVCAVMATRSSGSSEARISQTSFIRPTVLPATATATLVTLQQQVQPQTVSAATTTTTMSTVGSMSSIALNTSTTTITTRPTISLLPNVLAFRTHPLLTTPTLNLASPHAVTPTVTGGLYNGATSRLYSPIAAAGSFPSTAASPAVLSLSGLPDASRKMMRCQHCCIWFEDSALGLLHQSLHSADDTDPFTCKKCLKRLGNRLEFTAHIIWHLDPSMEDNCAI